MIGLLLMGLIVSMSALIYVLDKKELRDKQWFYGDD